MSFVVRIRRAGGEVKPLVLPLVEVGQSGPFQHARLVAVQLEDGLGRRAVEEVDAAAEAFARRRRSLSLGWRVNRRSLAAMF